MQSIRGSALMFAWFAALIAQMRGAESPATITEGNKSLTMASRYLEVEVSLAQPQFLRLAVDSLGLGHFRPSARGRRSARGADRGAARRREGGIPTAGAAIVGAAQMDV